MKRGTEEREEEKKKMKGGAEKREEEKKKNEGRSREE